MDSLLNQMRDFCLILARRTTSGTVDVVGGHVMHASSVFLTHWIAQRSAARCACGGPRSKIWSMSFFQPACPCTHSPGSQSIRVFSHFFLVLTVDVVGIYFLSHVLALILLHHPPSVLGENAGGKEAARSSTTSSRQHPRGNFPQFLPQDSRDGRCPGNLARSNVTLLRSPSFSADWSMSCEFCPLVAIFPSDIEFSS